MTIIPKIRDNYVIIKNTEQGGFVNETNNSMEKQIHPN